MKLTRRKTMALIGGGFIVAAAGGGVHVASRKPATARAPWAQAGRYEDPRMRALSWAILAPNPHNMQPWQVDLSTPDEAMLYVDTTRLLPHTDPFNRQITIGLGCFLELLSLAALQDGLDAQIDLFPQGMDSKQLDARPVARVRFVETERAPDPLFAHVRARRTLKEPFNTDRPVDAAPLTAMKAAIAHRSGFGFSLSPDHIAWLREFTHEALALEIETPRTYLESVDVMRVGAADVDANPDGIDFTGPIFELLSATGTMTREALLDRSSRVYQEGLAAVFANTDTAMGHFWMTTPGNGRSEQIALGRDWLRVHLAATQAGLGLQPLSQCLQEYPEMAAHYQEIHAQLALGGETVQMLARVGYGITVPPSPRWPIDAKVRNA